MAAGRSAAPCHGSIVGIEDISFLALQISEAFFFRNCWRICLFQAGDFAHKHVHPHVFLTQNMIRQIKKRWAQAQIAIDGVRMAGEMVEILVRYHLRVSRRVFPLRGCQKPQLESHFFQPFEKGAPKSLMVGAQKSTYFFRYV